MDLLMLWDIIKLSEQFSKIIRSLNPRSSFETASRLRAQKKKKKRAASTKQQRPTKRGVLEALAIFQAAKRGHEAEREVSEPLQHEVTTEAREPLLHQEVPEQGDEYDPIHRWRPCCRDNCIVAHIRYSGAVTYQVPAWEASAAEAPPRWPKATGIYHGHEAMHRPERSSPLNWEYKPPSEEWSEWERMMEEAFADEDE
jgi:hypothetical protein